MADVAAWHALAKLHHLNELEVARLMTCTPVAITQQRRLDAAAVDIREAHLERDHERLAQTFCELLRADLAPRLGCGALCLATLMVALERDEGLTPDMAVGVRLARVLSCKLERVYAFSKLFKE